jgi:hypothetical protein
MWKFNYQDLGNYRNKREIKVRDCFSNEPLKICLILFPTNLAKFMAVFHFLKSTSNDVTDVYITPVKEWFWRRRRDKIPDEGFLMTVRLITVSYC